MTELSLAFPLKPPARWNTVEVAVDVEFEHHPRIVPWTAQVEWLHTDETQLIEIQGVDENIDCTYWIVIGYVIVEPCREQRHLLPIGSINKTSHRSPRCDSWDKPTMISETFHTAWAIFCREQVQHAPGM